MKLPSYQFYTGDWLKDPGLRSVSYAARGLWIDMLSLMHESDRRGYLQVNGKPVNAEQLARMTGGSTDEVSRLLQELKDSGVYSCTDDGMIYSRRMVRDEKARKKTRERVAKFRNDVVTPQKRRCTEDESEDEVPSVQSLRNLTDKTFVVYCQTFNRNPQRYSLTEARRKKAEMRFAARLKIHNGDIAAVESEVRTVIANLAGSEFHRTNGFIDWTDQIFRSDEEYEKRLNWKQTGAGHATGNSKVEQLRTDNREAIIRLELEPGLRGGHGHNRPTVEAGAVPEARRADTAGAAVGHVAGQPQAPKPKPDA